MTERATGVGEAGKAFFEVIPLTLVHGVVPQKDSLTGNGSVETEMARENTVPVDPVESPRSNVVAGDT